jgi:hypothetical protein
MSRLSAAPFQPQHLQRGRFAWAQRRPPCQRLRCQATQAGPQEAAPSTARADYAAKAGDSAVLQRPLKSELLPDEIHNVFGYPRNLKEK